LVYTLKRGLNDTILYDEKAVRERFNFGPEILPDFKGLRGDPSDNIPGIKGIGEKTATELITAFGSVEGIYEALGKGKDKLEKKGIKPRIIDLLLAGKEEAEFSKMLATIRRDAPITFELPKKHWKETINVEQAKALFAELEFRQISARFMMLVTGEKDPVQTTLLGTTESVSPEEVEKVGLALWVLDSTKTNPTLEDILTATKAKDFAGAKKSIFDELEKQNVLSVYNDIELPLVPVMKQMSADGVLVDVAYLKKLSKEYHAELSKLEKNIWKQAGKEFNVNSPKQLGEILFETLGLKTKSRKRTSTGAQSTKESVLVELQNEHPIIAKILEYRELQKLLSTYIDVIPTLLGKDGRLHATFSQAGTTTGRMSSNNPNLQNIPIRSELGRKIRNAFIAGKGSELVAFDYSQIELRIAAVLSKDEKLMQAFRDGEDIHTRVAAEVFGVTPENVDLEMRRRAKIINFGIIYGMGVNALKTNLGTSREEAQQFYNRYFELFSGLASYLEKTKNDAARQGYVETMFGRRRYFAGINSRLPYVRAQAERMAINAPIQGTATADVVKLAMRDIVALFKEKGWQGRAKMILQVHDELIFEIEEGLVREASKHIKDIMESVLSREQTNNVPILVEGEVGPNWGEMKEL